MPEQNPDSPAAPTYDSMTAAEIAEATASAEGWNPEDGDTLDGVVVAVKVGTSDQRKESGRDPRYPIVFLLTDDAKVHAVHCFQAVLENEVKSQRPLPGERMYVKRIGVTGTAKVRGQSPPIRYAVQVLREAGTDDPWSRM